MTHDGHDLAQELSEAKLGGGGSLAGLAALQAYGAQLAAGQVPGSSPGYGPLAPKPAQNDPSMVLRLPAKREPRQTVSGTRRRSAG